MLAGKRASAAPSISLSSQGISGSAAPAELETGLQLLYENFVAPGDDPEQFEVLKRQLTAAVANRGRAPGQVFGERVEQINTSDHYTSKPLTTERIAALDRQKMLAFYRERFSNASDFTFFMVGAFKMDDALPLIAQYVGGLPSKPGAAAQFKDVGIRFPQTSQRDKVELGREPRSNVVVSFFADPSPDPVEVENVTAATTVLDIALRDILREDLGQTYTVSVGLSQALPQRGGGHIRVSFGAAPENVAAMTERVFQEIRRLQQEGPSADLTNRARESAKRNYETALQQNGYWLGRLQSVHLFGRDPKEIVTRPARIDAVTPKTVQDAFRTYFPMDRYTVVTLVPSATPAAATTSQVTAGLKARPTPALCSSLERIPHAQLNFPRPRRERAVVGVRVGVEGGRVVHQRGRRRGSANRVERLVGRRVVDPVEEVERLEDPLELAAARSGRRATRADRRSRCWAA